MKPNLFIVGAPKAGTTFVFEKLRLHPQLFFPVIKELNYFSASFLLAHSYYKDYKVADEKEYLRAYSKAKEESYWVDGSVSYLACDGVAQKIWDFNKDSKIIVVLRDPIKRAFSHYQMDKRMGYAVQPFISYISNREKYPFHYHQYIENSLYYKYLSHYISVFGIKNVLVLSSTNLAGGLQKLISFLGVSTEFEVHNSNELVNANKAPKNKFARYLQKNRKLVSQLKLIIPVSIAKSFNKLLYSPAKEETITGDEYEYCKKLFEIDQQELEIFLNTYEQRN